GLGGDEVAAFVDLRHAGRLRRQRHGERVNLQDLRVAAGVKAADHAADHAHENEGGLFPVFNGKINEIGDTCPEGKYQEQNAEYASELQKLNKVHVHSITIS